MLVGESEREMMECVRRKCRMKPPPAVREYRATHAKQEDHGQALYACAVNPYMTSSAAAIVATAGGNSVS